MCSMRGAALGLQSLGVCITVLILLLVSACSKDSVVDHSRLSSVLIGNLKGSYYDVGYRKIAGGINPMESYYHFALFVSITNEFGGKDGVYSMLPFAYIDPKEYSDNRLAEVVYDNVEYRKFERGDFEAIQFPNLNYNEHLALHVLWQYLRKSHKESDYTATKERLLSALQDINSKKPQKNFDAMLQKVKAAHVRLQNNTFAVAQEPTTLKEALKLSVFGPIIKTSSRYQDQRATEYYLQALGEIMYQMFEKYNSYCLLQFVDKKSRDTKTRPVICKPIMSS